MNEQQRLSNQQRVCLHALREARGSYVNGGYFLKELGYSQFHARIKELQEKGYNIVPEKIKRNGYYSYRLIEKEPMPSAFKVKVESYKEKTQTLL